MCIQNRIKHSNLHILRQKLPTFQAEIIPSSHPPCTPGCETLPYITLPSKKKQSAEQVHQHIIVTFLRKSTPSHTFILWLQLENCQSVYKIFGMKSFYSVAVTLSGLSSSFITFINPSFSPYVHCPCSAHVQTVSGKYCDPCFVSHLNLSDTPLLIYKV